MNPALLIHMATAHIKATVKGHEANSISYFVLEIKRNLCLFCVLCFRPLISRNIWLKGPFCRITTIRAWRQKSHCRPLAGLSTRQSTRDNPSSNHPLLEYWTLSGIDPGTNNDLNYHRVPVPSGDRHLQWASLPPPAHPPSPGAPKPKGHGDLHHDHRQTHDVRHEAHGALGAQHQVPHVPQGAQVEDVHLLQNRRLAKEG